MHLSIGYTWQALGSMKAARRKATNCTILLSWKVQKRQTQRQKADDCLAGVERKGEQGVPANRYKLSFSRLRKCSTTSKRWWGYSSVNRLKTSHCTLPTGELCGMWVISPQSCYTISSVRNTARGRADKGAKPLPSTIGQQATVSKTCGPR